MLFRISLPDTFLSIQETKLGVHWNCCLFYFVSHQKTTNENLNTYSAKNSAKNSKLKL